MAAAAAPIPYGQAAVPESVERAIEDRRVKQIIKTAAVEATTVVLQPWPEAPEPTAFLQSTVQLITKPTEPYRNVDNSMQYPPATYETRSLPDHPVILMEDTRESAKRQYASRGNSMPQTVVTGTYTGLTLAQAHKLRFAGLSQNGLSAKNAEEAGGESTLAMRMSGPGTVLNTSRNTFSPGDPISWGAPPVTQVRKVDERGVETVDTSKHPLTHIMDGTDADRGDMQTAVPTPFLVNPSTFVDRVMSMAQRLNRKASDVANLNGTSLKKYLYHGDMTALQKSLVHTFMAMKKYAECETDAQAELDIYWHQVKVLVDTLLPPRADNPVDIKDNVLVPVGDDDLAYCEVLASLSRAGPDNAKKSRQAALADYLKELSDEMKALGATPDSKVGDMRLHGVGNSFEVDVTRGPLSEKHKNTLVYTILRRAHALRGALQFVSVHGKCLEAHFLSLRSQIDAVVTAHSVPGGPLSFIIVKHA